jgi:hypothetical protein
LKWRRVLKKHGPCPATGPDGRERKKGGIGGERRKRIERGGGGLIVTIKIKILERERKCFKF